MIDYQLKFTDEAQALSVLGAPDALVYPNTDTIGLIEGAEGWHVNVRTDEATELEAYRVFPVTPARVWA